MSSEPKSSEFVMQCGSMSIDITERKRIAARAWLRQRPDHRLGVYTDRRDKWKGDTDSFFCNTWMTIAKMTPEKARIELFTLNFVKNDLFFNIQFKHHQCNLTL